jgi:hypothetical protein
MKKLNTTRKSYFQEDSLAVWESDDFMVFAYQELGAIRLDIERKDGKDGIQWEELQQIKNDCGFKDFDAIEFYPTDKDVINTGNWRHLYVVFNQLPFIRRL